MNRKRLIEFIDDYYTNSEYWEQIEDIIANVAGVNDFNELSDEDENEGFYANLTKEQLMDIASIIRDTFETKDYTLTLSKSELNLLLNAMEAYSDRSFTRDRQASFIASKILDRLYELYK